MKKQQIFERLLSLEQSGRFDDVVTVWNEYAANCCPDYEVFENDEYFMDEFGRIVSGHELACCVAFGNWRPSHEYVMFNGYENLVSFDFLTDKNCRIDLSELAGFIVENPELFEEFEFLQ